ncbi:hypothetical protein GEOBRER4_n2625 [Citrifermentans bremense]|uniref:Lipopolysaccharide biosynthesis protein n=1 Tax=Citrifermentans bremense TaxID=60035 RepID=A0A7R7FSY2_9BACT|nr:lipopolysaccharide biosynthesis protein [Citrifermentans bremense]BCO11454.1 hypothetical protein GEOBRER4_n2625 [Citrifermentans bremense]
MSSITAQGAKGIVWTSFSAVGRGGAQLLVLSILSRLLTPTDFGVASAAMVIANLSLIFSELGVSAAVVQRQSLDTDFLATAQFVGLLLSGALYLVVANFSSTFADLMRIPALSDVLPILGIAFLIRGLSQTAEGILTRNMRFKALSIIEFISYLVGYGVVGTVTAVSGFGYWSLVYSHLSQNIIQAVCFMVLAKPPISITPNWGDVRALFLFGNSISFGQLASHMALNGDNFVVSRWLGASCLGIYSRAYQLLVMPAALFGQVVSKVLFPLLSSIQNNPSRVGSIYSRIVGVVALAVLPVQVFFWCLAPEVVNFLLGPKWHSVIQPFKILVLALFFRTAYKISEPVLKSLGKVTSLAMAQVFYAVIVVFGCLFSWRYGLNAIALTVSIAVAVHFSVLQYLCWKYTKYSQLVYWRELTPGVMNSLIVIITTIPLSSLLRSFDSNSFIILFLCFGLCLVNCSMMMKLNASVFSGNAGGLIYDKLKNMVV